MPPTRPSNSLPARWRSFRPLTSLAKRPDPALAASGLSTWMILMSGCGSCWSSWPRGGSPACWRMKTGPATSSSRSGTGWAADSGAGLWIALTASAFGLPRLSVCSSRANPWIFSSLGLRFPVPPACWIAHGENLLSSTLHPPRTKTKIMRKCCGSRRALMKMGLEGPPPPQANLVSPPSVPASSRSSCPAPTRRRLPSCPTISRAP